MGYKKFSNRDFRLVVFNKCNGCCGYCGSVLEFDNFQIDHVEPKRRYPIREWNKHLTKGTDEQGNLLPSCQSCNASKSDLTLEDFRLRVTDRIKRLNDYSTEYQIAKRFGLITENIFPIVFYFEKINNGETIYRYKQVQESVL